MTDDDATTELTTTDPEMRQLLGLFDVPAFARRGQELEFALARLHARCLREREARLDMVRLRLRQWAAVATGPDDGGDLFTGRIGPLWPIVGAEPPSWAPVTGPSRRRLAAARDLAASVERFNRRWTRFLDELNVRPINGMIDHYNRYYVLEKECVFGSARLASRHFQPQPKLTPEGLLRDHPLLPPVLLRP